MSNNAVCRVCRNSFSSEFAKQILCKQCSRTRVRRPPREEEDPINYLMALPVIGLIFILAGGAGFAVSGAPGAVFGVITSILILGVVLIASSWFWDN